MAGVKRRTDFFEVNLSPKLKKPRESDPPSVLILAPFALIPKVSFNNVKVGEPVSSSVILQNPSDLPVEIQLEISDDLKNLGLEFNSLHFYIPCSSTKTLEIHWKPISILQGRGKVTVKHLNGGKKFSYITLSCSSVNPNVKKNALKKATKKVSSSTSKFVKKESSKVDSFADSRCEPLPAENPTRRETYSVNKPVYNKPGFSSNIKAVFSQAPPFSTNLTVLEEDFETHFTCSRLISSSPQAKSVSHESFKVLREPLKEYNFNNRQNILTKDNSLRERTAGEILERRISDSLFSTDLNFDRDSLDSPNVWNHSNSPKFEMSSFSLSTDSDIYVRRDIVPSAGSKNSDFELVSNYEPNKKEKPFYLTQNITPNSTFTQNESLFFREIPAYLRQNQSKPAHSPSAVFEESNSFSFISRNTIEPINDKLDSIFKAERTYTDVTYPASASFSKQEPNEMQESPFISVSKMTNVLQPVSFDISPARPAFRRSPKKALHQKFKKKITEENKNDNTISECKAAVYSSVFETEKGKISLLSEPDYLLHPYGLTTIDDPFSRRAVHPREWLVKLEVELIKWLNSLLTPPIELGSIVEGVDVKKLWDQSTASALKVAPSRETASTDYLSDCTKLRALNKVALALMRSDPIKLTVYNIQGKIDCGFLSVKNDISLYHNQGARMKIVQLCMYYNPLWLRIALEVLYGQHIPLQENNIHRGLVYFLKNRLLSDHDIVHKHKYVKGNHLQGPAFILEMNNFILLKFLTLIYFLDHAKMKKIIPYDPCLFCKNSPIKESEGMLNEFIKEFLKCVGQFKKTLKAIGYKLEYQQKYLDEFDYGLSTHLDLRDGVRLTRAMERILKDPSYSSKLWTPAFSRIQKIHNVQIAMSALQNNGYHISPEISATDIVNGHREKTFSFLWQILHEFLAPRYQSSAKIIQYWWRRHYLKIFINKRIKQKKNIVKIQALVRGFLLRNRIHKMHISALKIQKWYRKNNVYLIERANFILMRRAAIKIQNWFRSVYEMHKVRQRFLLMKDSAIIIQNYYRNYRVMKFCRNRYIEKKAAVLSIQKWYRNILSFRKDRTNYLLQRNSAIKIQYWFRSVLLFKNERELFLLQRQAILKIQNFYRNYKTCREIRKEFLKKRNAAILIQKSFKNYQLSKMTRCWYLKQKECAILIQRYFRAYILMKCYKNSFVRMKNSAIVIQKWFRSVKLSRMERCRFLSMKSAAIVIQSWFRVKLLTINEHRSFILKNKSALKIQKWFRNILQRRQKKLMDRFHNSAVCIQAHFRGYITRKHLQAELKKLAKKKQQNISKSSSQGLVLSVMFTNALSMFILPNNKCKSRNLGDLLIAYNDIDICTVFSPVLCLELSTNYCFFEKLWNDLNQGLRYGPQVEIFRHGLNILLKLAKFPQTENSLVHSMDIYDGYNILISLMGKFLEKNTDIYCKAATVLWFLLKSPNTHNKIKDKLDLERLNYFYKKMSKKATIAKKKLIPSHKLDWGYFNKPIEFLCIKTASEELRKLLI